MHNGNEHLFFSLIRPDFNVMLNIDNAKKTTTQVHYYILNTSTKGHAKLQGQQALADSFQTANKSTFDS
jgi:hypothetical protein